MMLFIFFSLFVKSSYSVGPIVSVPGILSSNLFSAITEPRNFRLCENFTKTKPQIWLIPYASKS